MDSGLKQVLQLEIALHLFFKFVIGKPKRLESHVEEISYMKTRQFSKLGF